MKYILLFIFGSTCLASCRLGSDNSRQVWNDRDEPYNVRDTLVADLKKELEPDTEGCYKSDIVISKFKVSAIGASQHTLSITFKNRGQKKYLLSALPIVWLHLTHLNRAIKTILYISL